MEISKSEAFCILDAIDDLKTFGKLSKTEIKVCRRIFKAWPSFKKTFPGLKKDVNR